MTVRVLEMLGAERLVYGRIGDAPFTLRIDGTLPPPKTGDTSRCTVARSTCTGSTPTTQQRV